MTDPLSELSALPPFDPLQFDRNMRAYQRPGDPHLGLREHWAWPCWGTAQRQEEFSVVALVVTDDATQAVSLYPLSKKTDDALWQVRDNRDDVACFFLTPGALMEMNVRNAADLCAQMQEPDSALNQSCRPLVTC